MNIYPVFIPHAGCPHRCAFCAQDRSSGRSAVPDVDEVSAWLEQVLPWRGDGEIAFYGGTFTLLPVAEQQGYLAVAGGLVARGRAAGIRLSTRPDALGKDCLERLQRSGVTTVEIGCQSFSPAVLAASDRGHTAADGLAAIRACRVAGLRVGAQLMPGLPGGDAAEALASLAEALGAGPDFVRIYPAVVLEGTRLAEWWRSGAYAPLTLDEAVDLCADMLSLCRRAGVPVIRLGLHPDPQLAKHLLAGPSHPAFGQLVRSRLWRRALERAGRHRPVGVHPHDLSDALGHRNENRLWLESRNRDVRLIPDEAVPRGSLRVAGREFPLDALTAPGGLHD